MTTTTRSDHPHNYSDIVAMSRREFVDLIRSIYEEGQTNSKFVLRDFQDRLRVVSDWSEEQKSRIFQAFPEDAIDRHLKTFVEPGYRVDVRTFLFTAFLNIRREVWSKPFLLYHRVNPSEYQKNMMLLEKIVSSETKHTLRHLDRIHELVPVVVSTPVELLNPEGRESSPPTYMQPIMLQPVHSQVHSQVQNEMNPSPIMYVIPSVPSSPVRTQPIEREKEKEKEKEKEREKEIELCKDENDMDIDDLSSSSSSSDSDSDSSFSDSDSESDSDVSLDSYRDKKEHKRSNSEYKKIITKEKVKPSKSLALAKKTSLQAYNNYLNPYLFSPIRKK